MNMNNIKNIQFEGQQQQQQLYQNGKISLK